MDVLRLRLRMRIIDLRISTLPTINGEKVVMRILDRNATVHNIDQLGLGTAELNKLSKVVKKPQGIILATGPTGSSKTTTLYSLLQHDATPEKNYVTIEDPVEYYLDMAGQVMVKEKYGMDFPTVLRAILRQDPDVILLGEIRDLDTAEVTFHAALTGHLVYSTLHTNSAVATIARLLDLGVKPYIVASALEAVIAQRLIRKICNDCREETEVPDEILHSLGAAFAAAEFKTFHGTGCRKCSHSGYQGRLAIHEVLVLDDHIRELISSEASTIELANATSKTMNLLIDDAARKVNLGLTTADEVLRVLGPQVL